MLYLLLWLLCAAAAAAIYARKGRSMLAAGLVGLLLGPIGVLLALLSSPDWTRVRRCPSCGEIVPRHQAACRACGAPSPSAAGPPCSGACAGPPRPCADPPAPRHAPR